MLLFRMVPGLKEASLQNDTGIQEREATPAERGRGGRGWLRVWGKVNYTQTKEQGKSLLDP